MKMSKRDEQIAKTALLIYPPIEAYRLRKASPLDVCCLNVGDMEFLLTRKSIRGIVTFIDFAGYTRKQGVAERRLNTEADDQKAAWCAAFARVALEVYEVAAKNRLMGKILEVLAERKLCRRICWSRAVRDLLAKSDSVYLGGSTLGIPEYGFNLKDLKTDDCRSLLTLAKNFVPTSAPIKIDTTYFVFSDEYRTPDARICLTHELGELN